MEVEPVIKYENGLEYLAEADEDDNLQNGSHVVINGGNIFQNGASVVQNGASLTQNGGHTQNGEVNHNGVHENGVEEEEEVDEEPPVNILTGADWESVNYTVNSVSIFHH